MFEGIFQPTHLLLVLGIVMIFFGPKKLPALGKGLGEGIRDFKNAISGHPVTEPAAAEKTEAVASIEN